MKPTHGAQLGAVGQPLGEWYYRIKNVMRNGTQRSLQLECKTCGMVWWTGDIADHPEITDPEKILRHALQSGRPSVHWNTLA
jgi:hypothetical protein